MNNLILTVLLSFGLNPLFGQTDHTKFLEDHYKLNLILNDGQENEYRKQGTLVITSKVNNQEIIRHQCDAIDFAEKYKNKELVDIPINSENYVIADDFNFDSINDLGILTFYSSKGPGYTVYLNKGNKFVNDTAFTNIFLYSQGNFELNPASQEIYIKTSGGCCDYAFSTYKVKNGKPTLISESIEEINSPYRIVTDKRLEGNKYIIRTEKTIDLTDESVKVVMSFQLSNKDRRAVLYSMNSRRLHYVLIKDEEQVEFNFPVDGNYKSEGFFVDKWRSEIRFINNDTEYKIYQKMARNKVIEVGILINVKGKEFVLKGDLITLYGSLQRVPLLENIVVR